MFIIVKIKCMNSNKISDICDKINFTINYTHFTTPDNILSKYTQIIFDTFGGMVLQAGGPKNFPGNNMGCDHILWCRKIWDREPISWWREMWALPARHKKFWAKVQSMWMDFWIKIRVLNELDPKLVLLSLRKIYWDGVSWPIKLCHVANIQS